MQYSYLLYESVFEPNVNNKNKIQNLSKKEILDINEKIVESYSKNLFRFPDKEGYASYINGVLSKKIKVEDIDTCIKNSDEYKSRCNLIEEIDEYINQDIAIDRKNNLENYNIKIYGPLGTSGYADAILDYIYTFYIHGANIEFSPVGIDSVLGKKDDIRLKLALQCLNSKIDYDYIIIFTTPLIWEGIARYEKLKKNNNVMILGMYVWETDKVRDNVAVAMENSVDKIVAPSKFSANIFKNFAKNTPVEVLHHIIDLPSEKINIDTVENNEFLRKVYELSRNNYVFYAIAQWNPRKDLIKTITSFIEEFDTSENVILVIKTFLTKHGIDDNKELIEYINELTSFDSRIIINTDLLSYNEIIELHKISNCYVSTSRSEGVGFSQIKASTLNPVIAPKVSGYTEYIENIIDVEYETIDVDLNYPPLYEKFESLYPDYKKNQKWLDIDKEDVKEKMRGCYKYPNFYSQFPKINKLFLIHNFSGENICAELMYILSNDYKSITYEILNNFFKNQANFNFLRTSVKILKISNCIDLYLSCSKQLISYYEIPSLHLILQTYKAKDEIRQYELSLALENNILNPFIATIHDLLDEHKYKDSFLIGEKVRCVDHAKRLTFYDAFEYANASLNNNICIVANNDIYFDQSLYYVKYADFSHKLLIALSRHDYNINDNTVNSYTDSNEKNPQYSQDTWLFCTPIEVTEDIDFYQGVLGCDNRIAYIYERLGYYIANFCISIIAIHLHTTPAYNIDTRNESNRYIRKLSYVTPTTVYTFNAILNLYYDYYDDYPSVIFLKTIVDKLEKIIFIKESVYSKIRILFAKYNGYFSEKLIQDIIERDFNLYITPELHDIINNEKNANVVLNYIQNTNDYIRQNIDKLVYYVDSELFNLTPMHKIYPKPYEKFYECLSKDSLQTECKLLNELKYTFENHYFYKPENNKVFWLYITYLITRYQGISHHNSLEISVKVLRDNSEIINYAYNNILHRNVDNEGYNIFNEVLNNDPNSIDYIYSELMKSDEYKFLILKEKN